MRTIPEIRARLKEVAAELVNHPARRRRLPDIAAEVVQLADETRRRPPVRLAPKRKANPNARLQAQIRAFAAANPTIDIQDIGQHFGVNSGRVSEAIAGKR